MPPNMGRAASAPPGPSQRGSSQAPGPYVQQGSSSSVQLVSPQPQPYYNGSSGGPLHPHLQHQPSSYGMVSQLPPGAMPPVNVEQGVWSQRSMPPNRNQSKSPPLRGPSPPMNSQTRRARSPPHQQQQHPHQPRYTPAQDKQPMIGIGAGGGRGPGRSLSATAVPPVPPVPQLNGNAKLRKGSSAQAVMVHSPIGQGGLGLNQHPKGISEEEDMPLAVYQAQRRK